MMWQKETEKETLVQPTEKMDYNSLSETLVHSGRAHFSQEQAEELKGDAFYASIFRTERMVRY